MENKLKAIEGHVLAEFVLTVPFLMLLVLTAVEIVFVSLKSVMATRDAYRAEHALAVYQPELADTIETTVQPVARINSLSRAWVIKRSSPKMSFLPQGLSDASLRGGDTPSPYCKGTEGYRVCGYPR